NILNSLYHLLPLANIQLAWLIPFIVLTIVGLVIDYFLSNNAKPETHQN
ncbi:branched-chain amino acid transport system II carrier protein, partial [Staphylococcus arlettae]